MSGRRESDPTVIPPRGASPPGPPPSGPAAPAPPGAPTPPSHEAWRTIALVAIAVFIVGGLATVVVTRRLGHSHASANSARVGAALEPTTVTTTFLQNPQPPPLLNTGEDWDTIVRSIVAYDDWLRLHPNPDLLDQYTSPTKKDYAASKQVLTDLATRGWHYDPVPPPVAVQHVEITTRTSPTRVGVAVRFGPPPEFRIVDQSGQVVKDTPAKPDGNTVEWTLVQSPGDPHWRLADVLPL